MTPTTAASGSTDDARSRVAVIGAASSAGARQIGQEQTPALFRSLDIVSRLRAQGLEVDDLGDIAAVAFRPDPINRKRQNLPLVAAVAREVSSRVEAAAREQRLPIVLGGDCTVTLGVLAGLAAVHENLGLLYFDADADFNTPETTSTGIFDGMGLAHIVGNGVDELAGLGPRQPLVPAERIVVFGLQQGMVEPQEQANFDKAQVPSFSLADVAADPLGCAKRALADLTGRVGTYLLHFDVDVVDYVDFPVAEVPHFNGLGYQEALQCLDVFLQDDRLGGLIITEFNALKDPDASYARRFLDDLVPLIASGRQPPRGRRFRKDRSASTTGSDG